MVSFSLSKTIVNYIEHYCAYNVLILQFIILIENLAKYLIKLRTLNNIKNKTVICNE